jgi:hypothetical protein
LLAKEVLVTKLFSSINSRQEIRQINLQPRQCLGQLRTSRGLDRVDPE